MSETLEFSTPELEVLDTEDAPELDAPLGGTCFEPCIEGPAALSVAHQLHGLTNAFCSKLVTSCQRAERERDSWRAAHATAKKRVKTLEQAT